MTEWNPMSTFPQDGTKCDILMKRGSIAKEIAWAQDPMSNTTFTASTINYPPTSNRRAGANQNRRK